MVLASEETEFLCLVIHNCFVVGSTFRSEMVHSSSVTRLLDSLRSEGAAAAAAATAKSLQSCPILCNPINSNPPCYTTPGLFQARTLEWLAISFSNSGK